MYLKKLFRGTGRSPARPYAVTFLLVVLFACLQYIGQRFVIPRAPLGLLYIPVMLSAVRGGWRATILASALSLLLSPLLLAPGFSFEAARAEEDSGTVAVFAMVCVFTCFLAAVLERSERIAQAFLISLKESEQTLRAPQESSTHAVLGIGKDGKIRFAMRTANRSSRCSAAGRAR